MRGNKWDVVLTNTDPKERRNEYYRLRYQKQKEDPAFREAQRAKESDVRARKKRERDARIERDPERVRKQAHGTYERAKAKGYFKEWAANNRDSTRAAFKKWKAANPQAFKDSKRSCILRTQYGITSAEYDRLAVSQGGVCAICRKPEIGKEYRTGNVKRLAVDHNHSTGRVRGLLCGGCNRGIGLLKESPENLRRAAEYLEREALCEAA